MTLKLVLLCGLLALALGVEFLTLEGKTADPCNKFLNADDRDCPPHSQLPDATVTVLVPSVTSAPKTAPGITTPVAGKSLDGLILTLNANQLPVHQNNYLMLSTAEGSCRVIDTTLKPIVIPAVADNIAKNPQYLKFTLPFGGAANGGWDSELLEIEDRPRLLCWASNTGAALADPSALTFRYTGFKIGVVWNCETAAAAATCGTQVLTATQLALLTPLQQQLRSARTFCCKQAKAIPGAMIGAGQCINPKVQQCCGAAAVEVSQERCCKDTVEIAAPIDGACPCGQAVGDCPVGESCCMPTKYTELSTDIGLAYSSSIRGTCYKPTKLRCCDTGSVFDPGSQQCCKINGIQSINTPCPCDVNSDCVTQSYPLNTRTTNFTCCRQTAPDVQTTNLRCSIYANYPSGQGTRETQACRGSCIDPRYQTCCNGAVCMSTYDVCCNSTCCNKWTATCFNALRSGALGNPHNPNFYFGRDSTPEIFEYCSSIEHITTTKGFWMFVLPSMLLLYSHIGLALVAVFAAKATPRKFSKLEWVMMGLALLVSYLVMPLYFAPVWKYPIWVVLSQLLIFLTATARIRWLNVLCVVVQAITLVYLFDPFHGNAFLTLSSNRWWYTNDAPVGTPTAAFAAPDDVMTSGVLHAIVRNWHTVDLAASQQYCYKFYDYFMYDPQLRDLDRVDNPQITMFGYCSRGWITALLIFSYFVMTGVLIQLVLSLLGIFIRFRRDTASELEAMEREAEY